MAAVADTRSETVSEDGARNRRKGRWTVQSRAASDAWTFLPLNGNGGAVQVSNPVVPLPKGIRTIPDFLSDSEAERILAAVDRLPPRWHGFDQRRQVWQFRIADSSDDCSNSNSNSSQDLPLVLQDVLSRFRKQTGMSPTQVTVEDYPLTQLKRRQTSLAKTVVTVFESSLFCSCDNADTCRCFVVQIPLCLSLVEHINRPRTRKTTCWDYHTVDHWTGIVLQSKHAYCKTNDSLWNWRSRLSSTADTHVDRSRDRAVVLKMSRLPSQKPAGTTDSNFGFTPVPDTPIRRHEKMPPIQQLLTVIVTTSPIKSNPSTEVLERTFATFPNAGHSFAFKCPKVVVCDGCRKRSNDTSRRHNSAKQAMRNGIVDPQQWENYQQFKIALKELCANASPDSPFVNTRVEELDVRHGYGFALRHALHHCVKTPYVIVIQHDRTFMRPTPVEEALKAMWHHRNIKYIGMSQRSNLMYRDIFLSKYGSRFMDDASALTLRLPELALDASLYGPGSESTKRMDTGGNAVLKANIAQLSDTYMKSQQRLDHETWLRNNQPQPPGVHQLSLTPTFFWYDNTHICETAHYRDFIFDPNYKMVARGGFVEDKVSPVIKRTVERLGLVDGHSRFGCFLLDDHSGMFFTGHLDGGSYIALDERTAIAETRRSQKRCQSDDD